MVIDFNNSGTVVGVVQEDGGCDVWGWREFGLRLCGYGVGVEVI